DAGEQVAKAPAAARRLAPEVGKVESVKIDLWRHRAARFGSGRSRVASRITPGRNVVRVEPVLIVDLALLFVPQDIVGFLDILELLFRRFVVGIEIRMILARQVPVRLADLLGLGLAIHPERFVVVLLYANG